MPINPSERCSYRVLDNGIHEFTIHEASRAAAHDMATHIDNILKATPVTAPPLRYIVDNSQVSAIPLNYILNRLKEINMNRAAEGRKPGRVAILHDGILGSIADMVLRVTIQTQVRLFSSEERSAAIDWLLHDN